MNKERKTLRQIRADATAWAQRQAEKERNDPALKSLMDALRKEQSRFFSSQR